MTWRKAPLLLLFLLAVLFWVSSMPSQAAEPAGPGGYFVRIPAGSALTAARLNLQPLIALDYDSFQWLELTAADYAKLSASSADFTLEADAGKVQVVTYTFDPLYEGEPKLDAAMQNNTQGEALRLVQFFGPTNDAWLADLDAAGLTPLQYYPHNAFLTWGTAAQLAALESSPFVRWQGVVHPAYKIDPALTGRSGLISNVDVMFYNDGRLDDTLDAIANLGGNVLQHYPSQPDKAFYNAVVQLDAAKVADVAQINTVLWMGYLSPAPILDDEMSSQIQAGNHPGGIPVVGYNAHLSNLGFNGAGVIWAVVDTGVDYDHPDLGPNIVGGYDFPGACSFPGQPGSDCSGGGHGTHVAGIIGGTAAAGFTDANGFLYGLGVAPGYSIFAMNSLSASAWPPTGGWQEHSKRAVLGGAIGGNNSWTTGEGTNHGYQASERTHDIMVLDGNFDTTNVAEPFIEVFSAGNSGPNSSTLTAPKEAKNLIITASSVNYRAGNINTISSFSSRGPAVDGRWVPTIAAPGEQIASSRNDLGGSCSTAIPGTNNMYAFCSGTSMASPHAAGAVVLATEWWRSFNGGADPSAAMAKALLVNTAVDMGTPDIPNINEGWGRVNITNIISPTAMVVYNDETVIFSNTGEQYVLAVGVPDPSQPLKITVAWSDAPGAAGANPALVNNLNLTVENGGNTYLGNVFSGGWSATGGAADNRNNIENVYIQNPGSNAIITIDAVNISGDAILYNGDPTDQSFALICSNCALFPDFSLSVQPTSLDICTPADATYAVNVGSILGYNDPVTLSASGNPAGTTAVFSVNGQPAPYTSALTIGNTSGATMGSYAINVVGVAPTSTHTTTVQLNLFENLTTVPTLVSPANGQTDVPVQPTFTWNAVTGSAAYYIEIATDIGFTNIVDAATVAGTSYTPAMLLNGSTLYYWRVTASNICGSSAPSATFLFVTVEFNLVCNVTPITIPSSGAGSPYPSAINVAGYGTDLLDVNVHLLELSHTWPDDIDILLVGPQGQNLIIMSDAGGSIDLVNVDLVLDDAAAAPMPDAGPITSGTYQPTNIGTGDTFPAPAPAPSSATTLDTFNGTDPNGTWSLYLVDDASGDTGTMAGGWCLELGVPSLGEPGIALTKTVGTDPDVYPLTDAITVTAGTTVTYFYVVENTGAVTLTLHTLQDDQLGTLLGPDFAYDLLPGDVVTVTESVVVTETVLNTAVWVATDGGASTAVATDSATVNVINPAIVLTKTVGTEAGVCATTTSIEVDAGTVVYYCYTVENVGDVTLALHDLDDDVLGALISGLAYDLVPGASVNTVAAGLTISATIAATTVNTAVWTAYNDAMVTAAATATATVTVLAPPSYDLYLPIVIKP